jgi:hypothetical protein
MGKVRLDILLRPGLIRIDTLFRARHQQDVLHIFGSSRFRANFIAPL